jgi:acetyl-CoA synthetase
MKENFSHLARYISDYQRSIENPEAYWDEIASTFLWHKRWNKTLEWDFNKPDVKWFMGGQLNITENCLDRHLITKANQTAIIWEANNPDESSKHITYQELFDSVCQFANVLKNNGIQKGDRVCIYMPMVPELAIAVLACARIGAVHSVVFAGFSSSSLVDRIQDASAKMVLTADGGFRGNKTIDLKEIVDEALLKCSSVEKVIVLERTKTPITMKEGRDSWWHDELLKASKVCKAEVMDSEDMLFILYTSGSTGKPKGMVHTCGGYMVYTGHTFKYVFRYKEGEIYWCTADIGWITGHSYILYAPLLNGATTLMFEGIPSYPDMGRFWQVIEKHKVNIFYTAPTAIRSLQQASLQFVNQHDLSSLRCLGTVGEPINAEAWHWYSDNIGKGKCPIVDTWWQTETGGILISPIAGVTPTKPTFATLPLPGIQPILVDERGREIQGNAVEGSLCIKFPFPSMARTIYGNHARFKDTYFSAYNGLYFTGDGAKRDYEGYYRITGRVDDVIIVSGHNLGTAEIENAINQHSAVCESAVIGYPHEIKGNAIYAYCICYTKPTAEEEENLRKEILQVVSRTIGAIAKPEKIQFVSGLPKTRSGKIMRRILRKVAENALTQLGDTSTLLNPEIVEEIIKGRL